MNPGFPAIGFLTEECCESADQRSVASPCTNGVPNSRFFCDFSDKRGSYFL